MTGHIFSGHEPELRQRLRDAKRVAVLGIKTEAQSDQPAFYVARYLADAGVEVVPVPVYYPDVTQILGRPVFRRLADVPGPLDIVDVFRRPSDVPGHLDDLLAKRPALVWLQLGIRHDEVAQKLAAAGIDVVQDRCLMVEHRRAMALRAPLPRQGGAQGRGSEAGARGRARGAGRPPQAPPWPQLCCGWQGGFLDHAGTSLQQERLPTIVRRAEATTTSAPSAPSYELRCVVHAWEAAPAEAKCPRGP